MSRQRNYWRGWIVSALALLSSHTFAQATRTTILTNGPTSNRLNLVLLSEGYRTNQLAQFLVDATNAVSDFLAEAPYQEYRNYFNAFAISVASVNSGSDHPLSGITNNTYFNSTYDSFGIPQLLTIPPDNLYDTNYSLGRGKVDALLAALMPESDLAMLIVNDQQYGGSGGPLLIRSLSTVPASAELALHESGHTLAGLGDEYDVAYPGYVPQEKPNTTTQTNRNLIKWKAWIATNTPIPTPETSEYANDVGLFEGAEYQPTGWYRPKLDCKMNHLGVPFCEVCTEQIVKSIYAQVRLIDVFNPAATNITITSPQALAFSVTPLQPTTHDLSVQWFTNGTAVSGATNATLLLQPQWFPNGNHTLQARVRDATPWVRIDPANLLSNAVTWQLNVSLSRLRWLTPQWLPDGRFACTVTGTAPNGFVIEASTNLAQWISLSTNSLAGGKYDFTNSNAGSFSRRFYRAQAKP